MLVLSAPAVRGSEIGTRNQSTSHLFPLNSPLSPLTSALLNREQSIEDAVDAIGDAYEVFSAVLEVEVIFIYYHHPTLVMVGDEVLVAAVEVI